MVIRLSTVLVVGAGASAPYGMPTGAGLRDQVLRSIGSLWLVSEDGRLPSSEIEQFKTDLSTSGFASVDAFLEWRPKWAEVGKTAMAAVLLAGEQRARQELFPPHGRVRDRWLEALWSRIGAPTWKEVVQRPLGIVTFNYDRLVEHYLCSVAKTRFGVEPATVLKWCPVVHVHGSLGHYDSRLLNTVRPGSAEIADAARAIKIVHETGDGEPQVEIARRLVDDAHRVLFLGFGYNPTNLARIGISPETNAKRLPPHHGAHPRQFVAGTHRGIERSAWRKICSRFGFWENADRLPGARLSDFVQRWLD